LERKDLDVMKDLMDVKRLTAVLLLTALTACGGGGGVSGPTTPVTPTAPAVAPITLSDLPTVAQVGDAEITEGSAGYGDHTLRFKVTVSETSGHTWSFNTIRLEATPNEGGMSYTPSVNVMPRSTTTFDVSVYFRYGDFDRHRIVFEFMNGAQTGYRVLLVLENLKEPRVNPPSSGPGPKPTPTPTDDICARFPKGGDAYNCSDFSGHNEAQQYHDQCDPGDRNKLDGDHDGKVCE